MIVHECDDWIMLCSRVCVCEIDNTHTHTPVTFRLMVTCSGGHDAACVCPPVCVRHVDSPALCVLRQ